MGRKMNRYDITKVTKRDFHFLYAIQFTSFVFYLFLGYFSTYESNGGLLFYLEGARFDCTCLLCWLLNAHNMPDGVRWLIIDDCELIQF